MRIRSFSQQFAVCVGVVALACACCLGAPQLDVTIGFDSQLLRNVYAPFRIELDGLAAPVDGSLVVRQTAGLPGERRAEIVHVVASGMIENGITLVTLPIAEPLNPVIVELQSRDGRTLAAQEKSLRLGVRQWAFPVTVGRATGIAAAAVIDAEELPLDWWAYDAAREVWLVDPPVPEEALEALGEWTVSGGSLVLFTGSAFPLMDSPTLRRLLPLQTPQLSPDQRGVFTLSGTLRPDARVTLARGTKPLLVQMPLGAGSISLITLSVDDLADDELSAIRDRVPATQRPPTTERVSAALLQSTDVPRPGYAVPLIVAGITMVSLVGCFLACSRRRWAIGGLVAVIVATAVLSGIYANASRRFVREYSIRTNVSVLSSFGINTAFCSFYAVEPRSVSFLHDLGSVPMSVAALGARGGTVAAQSEPGKMQFFLQTAERRDLMFPSRPRVSDLRFRFDGRIAEIENRTGHVIDRAYVASSGVILSLPPIQEGMQRLALLEGAPTGSARSTYLALRSILRPIEEWLPIVRRGAWLVTVEERPQTTERDAQELEREVSILILEGEAP